MAEAKVGGDVKAAAALALLTTLVAVIVGVDALSYVLSPVIVLALAYVLFRAPIRHSMMGIMFVALTIENPDEHFAAGWYESPFHGLGGLLLTHIKRTADIPVIGSLSGVDIMLLLLLVVAWSRKISGSNIDRAGRVETPKPLVQLALVSIAGVVWVLLIGIVRGGNMQMASWQVDKVIHLPIIFLLFHIGLRGPQDHLALARIVIGAAIVRALFAVYILSTVIIPLDPDGTQPPLPWATSHADSILFACATVILVALLLERARGAVRLAALVLPILVAGMVSNNRRMVWVQVALVFAVLYFATPINPAKRKIKIAAIALSPLVLAYLAMGWDSKGGGIFKPAQMVRSLVDPETDLSTLWRQIENYDLLFTIKQYWIFGQGYGSGYWEVMPLPPIDYSLERYLPHNSILGLWCFAGLIGYTAFTLLWGAGVYFAMRAYYAAKKSSDRVAALACIGAVLIYMIQCYGDVGLGSWVGVFTVGAAVAVGGKLAVSLGAWPSKKVVKKAAPAPVRVAVESDVA